MSTAPTIKLIKRDYATMQTTIDDDGVHFVINHIENCGMIALTFDEAISLGELLVKLKDEPYVRAQMNKEAADET